MASQVYYFCLDPNLLWDLFCTHWGSFGPHFTILHLSRCTSRVVTVYYLEVRVELQTLNKRFLGGNPSFYSLFKKNKKKQNNKSVFFFFPLPPFPFESLALPSHRYFSLSFSLRTMKILSMGGCAFRSLGAFMAFGGELKNSHCISII